MPFHSRGWLCSIVSVLTLIPLAAFAQQTIGSVATQDASVAGALEVAGGRAVLVGSSSVTARDHSADVALVRGGVVRICQTSGVKLSSGVATLGITPPLMLALDRGALEVRMQGSTGDALLTPDLRFSIRGTGAIDLRLRVTGNGDTCVEQRSLSAPPLVITDNFGEASYEVRAGQHVLFEHGSLREVVDHETSPCGCPEPPHMMSLAEAALRPPGDAATTPAAIAAGQHPFPAAESAGLAAGAEVPQAPSGVVHTQVAATLGFDGATPAPSAAPTPVSSVPVLPQPAAKPQEPRGLRHSIGRFFHRLFGGGA